MLILPWTICSPEHQKTYDAILNHYRENGIKSPIGGIVLVAVNEIAEVTSPLYDQGFSEEEIKKKWKKYFLDL